MIYLIPATILTILNLTFAAVGPRMVPLFYIADATVLAAVFYALWECRRQPMTFATFTLVGHFYAYNTVAKIADSGLEKPLLWFVIDPVIVALLAWKGLQPTRAPEQKHEDSI